MGSVSSCCRWSGCTETARYTLARADGHRTTPCLDGFRRLADTIHAHGTPVVAQIFHPGREIMESQDGSAPVALAPSAVPTERFHVMPRAMPVALIDEVVTGFGQAARRLQLAGLDGVEIVASHGYLPAQFFNPAVNLRTDAYGGAEEKRLRFVREVIASVRAAVGRDFVVGIRVSADELSHGGLGADEMALGLCCPWTPTVGSTT